MANGRFVSRTIAMDKRLAQLSMPAEYLFLKTIPHLDRDGLILADVLWATVAPRRPEMAAGAAELWQEWVDCDLAIAYETGDGTVLYFPGFQKNQQGMRYDREAPSHFAPPPGFIRTDTGLQPADLPTYSGPTPDELRTYSGLTPPQVQGQVEVEDQRQRQGQTPVVVSLPIEIDLDQLDPLPAQRSPALVEYERCIGMIGPLMAESIEEAVRSHPAGWVVDAIKLAPNAERPSWAYVRGVLKNWTENGRNGANNGNGHGPKVVDFNEPEPPYEQMAKDYDMTVEQVRAIWANRFGEQPS